MSKPEAVDAELETLDMTTTAAPVPTSGPLAMAVPPSNHIDAIIAVAEKMDALGTALDRIRSFAMKRAMPGDWVRFKGKDDDGSINLTGPGAERIAAAVGVSFIEWKSWKEEGRDEKGPWYRWYFQTTALAMGRRIEAIIGHAGTRDRFFGVAHGGLKDLSDISEADIRTAARRNAMKEGVRILLGLRRMPVETAVKELGLIESRIKTVEFGGKSSGSKAAASSDTPAETFDESGVVGSVGQRKAGDKTVYIIKTEAGGVYDTFSETDAKAAKAGIGKTFRFRGTVSKWGKNARNIEPVEGGVENGEAF